MGSSRNCLRRCSRRSQPHKMFSEDSIEADAFDCEASLTIKEETPALARLERFRFDHGLDRSDWDPEAIHNLQAQFHRLDELLGQETNRKSLCMRLGWTCSLDLLTAWTCTRFK